MPTLQKSVAKSLAVHNVWHVNSRISKEREEALGSLIDDDTPSVHDALLAEFRRLGESGVDILRNMASAADGARSAAASQMLEELESASPSLAVINFIERGDGDLETGAKLISAAALPREDASSISRVLDSMAARVESLIEPDSGNMERCKAINRVMFHEYCFRGISEIEDEPGSVVIASVIRRRRGSPLALSIVYVLVAKRLGVNLDIVDMPGRVLVLCGDNAGENAPFYVDAFERGAFRHVDQILEILRKNDIEPERIWFEPLDDFQVLYLCCRVLAAQFEERAHKTRAGLFNRFVSAYEKQLGGTQWHP